MASKKTQPAAAPGELIALEGLHDKKLETAAKKLLRASTGHAAGISVWDASGLFFQLDLSACPEGPSPKTVLMLYAADLAFRLRWEIEPYLAEGKNVAAVPYIETAIAFGRAAGVDPDWMDKLFAFAPPATRTYGVPGGAKPSGFPSHAFGVLAQTRQWQKLVDSKLAEKHLAKLKPAPNATKQKSAKGKGRTR